MGRAFLIAACLTLLAYGQSRAQEWTKLKQHRIDRFEISLPAGGNWYEQSGAGERWVNVSRRINTAEGDLYVWVGFEVNSHPENRYDWLPAEVSREVRDVQAMKLVQEAEETEKPLAILEYGDDASRNPTDYWLVWARHTYIEQLGREVPEYQELHVFLPDDHNADFKQMAVYFGVYCLADCTTDFPSASFLRPILETVAIGGIYE